MRKLVSLAATLLSLAAAPAFSQGVQTPGAPNATPPIGTVPNMTRSPASQVGPTRHHRRTPRHAADSRTPAGPTTE
jgi:hypothetical protein